MIAKLLGVCVISLIAAAALAADVPKEVICGEIVIKSNAATPQVKGKLVLRQFGKGRLRPVFIFPNGYEAMFTIDPNGMYHDPLWQMIAACMEGQPPVKDVRP